WTEVVRSASYVRAGITEMTAAWRKSTAHSSAKRVATVDATPSESSRNEFAIQNGCPRKAHFKYLVRSKSFVITSRRNRSGNRFQQCRAVTCMESCGPRNGGRSTVGGRHRTIVDRAWFNRDRVWRPRPRSHDSVFRPEAIAARCR